VTSSDDEQLPDRDKARWVYEKLRRRIELGVWPHGYPLPSEKDLRFKPPSVWLNGHLPPSEAGPKASEEAPQEEPQPSDEKPEYMSQTTARAAVIKLEAIGRAFKHHGKLTEAYMPSMAPHWLVVDLPKPWPMKLAAVAEPETHPAIALIPAKGSKINTRWRQGENEYEGPEWDSKRLGIDTGTKLRTNTMTLVIDDEPVLTSISFVPSDLLSGPVTWQQKPPVGKPALDVGELALAGVSLAFDSPSMHARIPTFDESEPLEPVPGIPVYAAYRQCRVTPVRRVPATSGRACVVVVARADLVRL